MIKQVFKIIVAVGIFYWLITTGKLDFSLVARSFDHPMNFLIAALLVIIQLTMAAFRFGFLLRTRSPDLSMVKLINIQWIAQLFSTVIPGGFTSDLVKIGYVRELDEKLSKSFILFIILFDRIIGLSSLLFIAGLTSLIFFQDLKMLGPMMEKVIYINIFLFVSSLVGISFIFIKESYHSSILRIVPAEKLRKMLQQVWTLRDQKRIILISYFVSIGTHLLGILAFWIINRPFFEGPIEFKYLASLIPLGQLSVAVPISPGGIGVGHAAFATLFNFIHHTNGASLFNVFWIMLILINCIGIFPFLFKRKLKKDSYGSRNL